MSDYDIGQAFEEIENELIDSIMHNISRHEAEETVQGLEWSMWQAEQLRSLEKWKKENQKKFPKKFQKINQKIGQVLRQSYRDGQLSQEREILKSIEKGFDTAQNATHGIEGAFFEINDKKLNTLIKSVTDDFEEAEIAVLRRADDQYRRIIFDAQVFANTGAGTYKKVVDMATKDFLVRGIDCIEYKNGSRHSIKSYSQMAIRTANKRAYLQGEGAKRQEYGVSTVIVHKRNGACPRCAQFVGKVFIDDVWSGGDKSGKSSVTGTKYPLLSSAIASGLFHPNCKDGTSTYYEGISQLPDGSYSREELHRLAEKYKKEQQTQYAKRQAEKYERLAKYSIDEENQRIYITRANEWNYMSHRFKPQYRGKKEKIKFGDTSLSVIRVENSEFNFFTDSFSPKDREVVEMTERNLRAVRKMFPSDFGFPKIVLVDFEMNGIGKKGYDAIGGYLDKVGIFFMNSKFKSKKDILNFVRRNKGNFANTTEYSVYLHELGHKYYYDMIKSLAQNKNISYNRAQLVVDNEIHECIRELKANIQDFKLATSLSQYAQNGYTSGHYTEIIAECIAGSKVNNKTAVEILKSLEEAIK